MTAAVSEYAELHQLVDRLNLDQARALRAVALQLVLDDPVTASGDAFDVPSRHVLSFAGVGHGGPDLAAETEKILTADRLD